MMPHPVHYIILEAIYYTALSLRQTVGRLRPGFRLEGVHEETASALGALRSHRIGLVIADVEAADGDTIEAFTRARVSTPVIFLSETRREAERAGALNTVDYLLHPVSSAELEGALCRFEQS